MMARLAIAKEFQYVFEATLRTFAPVHLKRHWWYGLSESADIFGTVLCVAFLYLVYKAAHKLNF